MDKDETLFPWRNKCKGIKQKFCNECKRSYNKTWYDKNKESHKTNVLRNNSVYREWFVKTISEVKSVPCADCGISYPSYVMDFDHLEGTLKLECVSKMTGFSKEKILAEIAKCEVVCSNCHRIRTFSRRNMAV